MTHTMHSWAGTENNPGRTGHTENGVECTYPTLTLTTPSVDTPLEVGGTVDVTAEDFVSATSGANYWRIEVYDQTETSVVLSDSNASSSLATVQFDCDYHNDGPFWLVKITAWDKDLGSNPEWEVCGLSATTYANVTDPLAECAA